MIKIMFKLIMVILITSFQYPFYLQGQSSHKWLLQGDKSFKNQDFTSAEENYRKALDKKKSRQGQFNLGNAVYEQQRFDEATQHYQSSKDLATTDDQKAHASYNLGNAQLKSGKLDEAISAYKEAIKLAPDDIDMRTNLYKAKLMQKQQRQQQQEQEKQSEEQKNDEKQDQSQQQDQQQQPSQQSEVDNESSKEEQQQQQQEMSREDAEKLLQVIENEEKNVQEKMRKVSGSKKKPKKDW